MYSKAILTLLQLLSIHMILIGSLPVAKIVNAIFSAGSSFSKVNLTTVNACMCSCIRHPHCLSSSVIQLSNNSYYCQLFATYPAKSTQLSSSLTSNVTIYTGRVLSSVYLNSGTKLTNPTSLFSNTTSPWIPAFKLFTGSNQSFLWMNSSNLTTLTSIPSVPINQTATNWYNILISQWNQYSYVPQRVAIAFIVNNTIVIDFLIFNGTSDVNSWYSIANFVSNQYWSISPYRSTSQAKADIIPVYTDSDCIRSFNCNFKGSTSGCTQDFTGFYFLYGGYRDLCIAAVRNISTVAIPTIFYSPTSQYTSGNLSNYGIANGLMGFVQ